MLEAFEAATLHSAHMLGINHQKGTFNADTDVNFVFF
jgi:imidazolonepropionase-like amidohydrolase